MCVLYSASVVDGIGIYGKMQDCIKVVVVTKEICIFHHVSAGYFCLSTHSGAISASSGATVDSYSPDVSLDEVHEVSDVDVHTGHVSLGAADAPCHQAHHCVAGRCRANQWGASVSLQGHTTFLLTFRHIFVIVFQMSMT